MRVVGLYRYPVKSLRGHALAQATVEPIGLAGDRRWMVVDEALRFLTIRQIPAMTTVDADLTNAGIVLRHAEAGEAAVATPGLETPLATVLIWKDQVAARIVDGPGAALLTRVLGRPVRLAWLDDPRARPVDPEFGAPDDHTSFADGYPALLTTVESLADLNGRLPAALDMRRFRPNIVVAGAPAWAEDGWLRVAIGAATFRVVKPCARCVITTRDPDTGAQTDPHEPLRTLGSFHRASNGGVIFGQNLVTDATGEIAVGDPVTVLSSGPSNLGARRPG